MATAAVAASNDIKINVEVIGDIESRTAEFQLKSSVEKGKEKGKAKCFRYGWRGRTRNVWVAQDGDVVDAILTEWWPYLAAVPFDLEYAPQSSEPAVVSLALTRDVALLWHRPDPDKARRMPEKLAQLLASEGIPKVGFAIDNDIWKLAASTDLLGRGWPKGLFDIQTFYRLVSTVGKDAVGMTEVVNSINPPNNQFAKIPHSGQWNKPILSCDQIVYAAGDVLVTWEVVDALSHSFHPYVAQPSNQPVNKTTEKFGEDEYGKVMGSLRVATEMVRDGLETQESATWLAKNCPNLVRETMQFLVNGVGEEKLPRPSRLRRFLAHCCPAISKFTTLTEHQKNNVADVLVQFITQVRWLAKHPINPNHLTIATRNPILRFILSHRL